jgi:hypothetical protein
MIQRPDAGLNTFHLSRSRLPILLARLQGAMNFGGLFEFRFNETKEMFLIHAGRMVYVSIYFPHIVVISMRYSLQLKIAIRGIPLSQASPVVRSGECTNSIFHRDIVDVCMRMTYFLHLMRQG